MFFSIFSYFFWGYLLVKEAMALIPLIITPNTIRTTYAIIAEDTFTTVCELMRIPAGVTLS